MKPTRSSSRTPPLLPQLSLPLRPTPITALSAKDRAGVVAVLARLLLEAARPWPDSEDDDVR
jgi:hypothetical protein